MTNKICNNLLKHILILSVLFCIFTISFISPRVTYAQNLIFEDNFNDNNINLNYWEINNYNHARYGSSSLHGQLNINEINQEIQIIGSDYLPDIYDTNYNKYYGWFGKSLLSRNYFSIDNPFLVKVDFKVSDADIGYAGFITIEFNQKNRIVLSIGNYKYDDQLYWPIGSQLLLEENEIVRWVGKSLEEEYQDGVFTNDFNLQRNRLYKIEVLFNPNTRHIFAYIDGEIIHAGTYQGDLCNFRTGVAASVRSTGNYIDARFDDFKLYAEPTEKTLNVPDLKQFTAQWANLEYDSAKKWYPTNPTISRWGCALTSASMILKYYGHDINPDALNEWLNAQKDGYTRNGSIIWPAISRLTQLRYSKEYNWPILEFSYVNYSYESLKDNIKDDKPGILKLLKPIYDKNGKLTSYSSHFIVGKGYDNTDILINDPGINGHESLSNASSYWGYPSSVVNFKKTETDLSYIVLFIDDEFDIKLTNNQGEVLEGECFFKEAPMTDPENPNAESSGIETLNAFYYPKPETGTYNIEISGSGIYRLDYYIYDDEGKVTLGNSFGLIDNTSIDVFEFDFDKNNVDYSELPKISFETVVSFWDRIYNNGYIESHGLYTSVRHLLKNAENNINNNGNSSKRLLFNIIKKLEKTDRHIDKVLFNHFIYQIETLISDL